MTTLINTALANNFYVEPLNVNPNWLIDQIQEGATATTTATAGGVTTQIADGWTVYCLNPSGAGNGALRTSVVADPDFASCKALKIECTTADTTVSAGDRYELFTAIEGYDLAHLNPGTASAGQITIKFQFKSNKTGVYCIRVANGAANRSYVGTITVEDTSVHDYSVTLTLDTTGTWLYTNGAGCYVTFALMAGSTYQTTAGSWQAGNFTATSSQVNFMDANTNVAYLGRFHVIPGNVVRAYKPADIRLELAKAQRQLFVMGGSQYYGVGVCSNATDSVIQINFPTTMRTTPTLSTAGTFTITDVGAGSNNAASVAINTAGPDAALLGIAGSVGSWSATYRPVLMSGNASARLRFNARLS